VVCGRGSARGTVGIVEADCGIVIVIVKVVQYHCGRFWICDPLQEGKVTLG
jgi:hypothetical protein